MRLVLFSQVSFSSFPVSGLSVFQPCSLAQHPPLPLPPLDHSHLQRATSGIRTYTTVVDNLDNGSQLASVRAPADEDHTANLNQLPLGNLHIDIGHGEGLPKQVRMLHTHTHIHPHKIHLSSQKAPEPSKITRTTDSTITRDSTHGRLDSWAD